MEFKSPLDPDLIKCLNQGKNSGIFDESKDIWAMGITVFCYIFGEDINAYYDWNSIKIETKKISENLAELPSLGYTPGTVKLLREILDQNHITRINTGRIREILKELA